MQELITVDQAAEILNVSKSTIDRLCRDESAFPDKIQISRRCVRLDKKKVQDYIKAKCGNE